MIRKILLVLVLAGLPATAHALQTDELLSLVAMPLAVAAVSEIADVPINDLIDVVTMLNQADVPPAQFIEVVRYVPVALVVENDEPDFVEFVRLRRAEGLAGDAFVTVLGQRIETISPGVQLNLVTPPQVVVVEQDFVPVIVRTRVAERKSHPHGGPPGQLKKIEGVQTGAEIVHGARRGRDDDDGRRVRIDDDRKGPKVKVVKVDDSGNRGKGKAKGNDGGNKGNKGNGKGKGKGKS